MRSSKIKALKYVVILFSTNLGKNPSVANRMKSFGYAVDNSDKNTFMQSVLQYGSTRKNDSPV